MPPELTRRAAGAALDLSGRRGAGIGPGAARRHAARRRAATPAVPLRAAFGPRRRRGGPGAPGRTSPASPTPPGTSSAGGACGSPSPCWRSARPCCSGCTCEFVGRVQLRRASHPERRLSRGLVAVGALRVLRATTPAVSRRWASIPSKIRPCWNEPLGRPARPGALLPPDPGERRDDRGPADDPGATAAGPGGSASPAGISRLRRLDRSEIRRASTAPRPGAAPRASRPRSASPSPPLSRVESSSAPEAAPAGAGPRPRPWTAPAAEQAGGRAVPRRLPGRAAEGFPGLSRQGPGRARAAHPPAPQRRPPAGGAALGVSVRRRGPWLPGALRPHSGGALPGAERGARHAAGRAAAADPGGDLDPAGLPRARRGGRGVAAARRGPGAAPAQAA